jgi:3-oxoacyl-[acyl-carrier protein] reductase
MLLRNKNARYMAKKGAGVILTLCLMPHAIPEAAAMGSHSRDVFRPFAERAGLTVDQMLARHADTTLLKRLPTLVQVANVAAFVASDQAGAMTGTVANLTCGTLVD